LTGVMVASSAAYSSYLPADLHMSSYSASLFSHLNWVMFPIIFIHWYQRVYWNSRSRNCCYVSAV